MSIDSYYGLQTAAAKLSLRLTSLLIYGFIFLLVLVLFSGVSLWALLPADDRHNAFSYGMASLFTRAQFHRRKPSLILIDNGQRRTYSTKQYHTQKPLQKSIEKLWAFTRWIVPLGGILGMVAAWLAYHYFSRYYRNKKLKTSFIRGGTLVEPHVMRDLLKARNEFSDLSLGDFPVVGSYEQRHIAMNGDTGVGKSQAIMRILDTLRSRGDKALVVDKSGEYMQHFYNPETDFLLSPFDERSRNWTPFVEGTEMWNFEALARSFFPPVSSESQSNADHWAESAVTVFSNVLYQLYQEGVTDIDGLLDVLVEVREEAVTGADGRPYVRTVRGIERLIKNTLAALVVDPDAGEHAASVLGTIIPKIRALQYLRGLEDRPLFSIRDWVRNDDETGWLFIRASQGQLPVVRSLISAWTDAAVNTILGLPKSDTRVLWYVIDELQSYDKLPALTDGLFMGRKHGARLLLGFTSPLEIQSTYGEKTAKAMLSMVNTSVVFRTSEPDSAEWNAKVLGEEEVFVEQQQLHAGGQRNLSLSDSRETRPLVIRAQVQYMKDLTAWVRFAGDWPLAQTSFPYIDRPDIAEIDCPRSLPPPRIVTPEVSEDPETALDNEEEEEEEEEEEYGSPDGALI